MLSSVCCIPSYVVAMILYRFACSVQNRLSAVSAREEALQEARSAIAGRQSEVILALEEGIAANARMAQELAMSKAFLDTVSTCCLRCKSAPRCPV